MGPWDSASRWINTALLVVVGVIGFDTLFRLLAANETNVIVGFTRAVADVLLAPFQGMFDAQEYLLTALIAVLGYALLAGIALAVTRSVQSSRRRATRRAQQRPQTPQQAPGEQPGASEQPWPGPSYAPPGEPQRGPAPGPAADPDRTQPLAPGAPASLGSPTRPPPPAGGPSPSADRTAGTGEQATTPGPHGDDADDEADSEAEGGAR